MSGRRYVGKGWSVSLEAYEALKREGRWEEAMEQMLAVIRRQREEEEQ